MTPSPAGEGWQKSLLSSAHKPNSRPPCIYSGRAGNACTNLLGFFVRYVRTRGIDEAMESAKPPIFALFCAARTCHARLARLTRARGGCFLRGRKALLNDFWYFWSRKSTIKEKYLYISSRANDVRPYSIESKLCQHPKQKIRLLIRFFFCIYRRKRKSYKKENAGMKFRALRSTTKAPRLPRLGDADTHASHMCQSP